MITGYGKVWSLGNPNLQHLLAPGSHVVVQEKVDGSQFSFALIDGKIYARSKGVLFDCEENVEGMFKKAYETVKRLHALDLITPNLIYRCEYLASPKHNTIVYGRAPLGFLVLYDVHTSDGLTYYTEARLKQEAELLDIDCVKTIWEGPAEQISESSFSDWLRTGSSLGGEIEGFVIKNRSERDRFDGALLKGKFVRETFKEDNRKNWKQISPKSGDIIDQLSGGITSHRRWEKSIERFRDEGKLHSDPKDIGPLMKDIRADAKIELEAELKEMLWKWAWPKLERATTEGFPEWYKERLAKSMFQKESA